MRLWHKDLISVLPKQQLVGQWRECCLIAREIKKKGTPNHLLVNKIMQYPISHFIYYTNLIKSEMFSRGYRTRTNINITAKNEFEIVSKDELFKNWHTDRYLLQCLFNLQEKFDCGGIPGPEWKQVRDFIASKYDIWDISLVNCLYRFQTIQ